MIESKDLWNPQGLHGELAIPEGGDIEQAIKRAIRKISVRYEDIKYCVRSREDGTSLVYFELLD